MARFLVTIERLPENGCLYLLLVPIGLAIFAAGLVSHYSDNFHNQGPDLAALVDTNGHGYTRPSPTLLAAAAKSDDAWLLSSATGWSTSSKPFLVRVSGDWTGSSSDKAASLGLDQFPGELVEDNFGDLLPKGDTYIYDYQGFTGVVKSDNGWPKSGLRATCDVWIGKWANTSDGTNLDRKYKRLLTFRVLGVWADHRYSHDEVPRLGYMLLDGNPVAP